MKPGNVLLIGGNGFLGAHTAQAFKQTARSVHILDMNSSVPQEHPNKYLPQYEGSVADLDTVRHAINKSNADTIVLLASFGTNGMGLVKSAEKNPQLALEVNVFGLLNVLQSAASRKNCRVLWMSSTTVYGQASCYNGTLVSEEDLVQPQSIYAATKVLGEQLIRSYRNKYGIEATAIRPSLVWGPGIRYRGVQSALNDIVEAAASGESAAVEVSSESLDLIYIRDAALVPVWLSTLDNLPETILVNGYQASLNEVRKAALQAVPGITLSSKKNAPHLGFPHINDSKARQAGYQPRYDLQASVKDFLQTVSEGDVNAYPKS